MFLAIPTCLPVGNLPDHTSRAAHNRRASTCHPEERPFLPRMKDLNWRKPTSSPHPAFFQLLLQTKHFLGIDPWVSLATRLGGPWVTLGSPKGHPIPDPIPSFGRGSQRLFQYKTCGPQSPSPATVNGRDTALGKSIFCCKRSNPPSFRGLHALRAAGE